MPVSRYAKAIVAALAAALMVLSNVLPIGSTAKQWADVALAVLGALLVLATPNAPAAPSASTPPAGPPSAAPLP
jgi:hypothetical protein